MAVLAIVALGVIAWAWLTGRLAGWTGRDVVALAAVVIGAKFLAGGSVVAGLVAVVAGGLWLGRHWARLRGALWTRRVAGSADLAAARDLLGVMPTADERIVRAAYRDRIVAAHPDRGGNVVAATRLAAARDLLLADIAARRRR
ncbi:MAG: J domain-containing protein [Sphingomonadales bacterium]|nr:J domain-containing protein [Sphingomonadales bacterium]